MPPAYIDPLAPGLVEAWMGALRTPLVWLLTAVGWGTIVVTLLVVLEAVRSRRRRTPSNRGTVVRLRGRGDHALHAAHLLEPRRMGGAQ